MVAKHLHSEARIYTADPNQTAAPYIGFVGYGFPGNDFKRSYFWAVRDGIYYDEKPMLEDGTLRK